MFWSDTIAKLIVEREKFNYIDKKVKRPSVFTVKSSTSISGVPHIGNASDVLRGDAVVRSLKELGESVRFIWVAEDMDPLRKVPAGIPKEFEKYLGQPVSSIPAPDGSGQSYVKYFVTKFIDSLRDSFGTAPELLTMTDIYRSGDFTPYIVKALEEAGKIKEILDQHRRTPLADDWCPYNPVCENCGKLITTKVTGVDGTKLSYSCEDYSFKPFGKEAYTKLKGCGHKGTVDIAKGAAGKLNWKVEWAAEWALWGVNFEPAGKEHFMPGASFWNAGEIAEKVFGVPEPYPGKNEIQPYEYVLVGKEKMSASVGNVVSTWDWPKFAPPETLRLLFIKRPNRTRTFDYAKIPDMVDELDRLEKLYFGLTKVEDKKGLANAKRLYEMCCIAKPESYVPNVPFGFAAVLAQIVPKEKVADVLKATGHVDKFEKSKDVILTRLAQAGEWARLYAPQRLRVAIAKEMPKVELSKGVKAVLSEVAEFVEKGATPKEITETIRSSCKKNHVELVEFFKAAYRLLINAEQGPRLSNFLLVLDKAFIVNRLKLKK